MALARAATAMARGSEGDTAAGQHPDLDRPSAASDLAAALRLVGLAARIPQRRSAHDWGAPEMVGTAAVCVGGRDDKRARSVKRADWADVVKVEE